MGSRRRAEVVSKISDLGERIRSRRRALGMSQEDLAKALGAPNLPPVAAMTISRWERGQRAPSRRHRRRLADVLGGTPADYEEDEVGPASGGADAPGLQQPKSERRHVAVSRAEVEQMKEDVVVVAADLATHEPQQPDWRPHLTLYASLVGRLLADEVIYFDEVARLLEITQAAEEWRMETLGRDDIADRRARWLDLLRRLAEEAPRRSSEGLSPARASEANEDISTTESAKQEGGR